MGHSGGFHGGSTHSGGFHSSGGSFSGGHHYGGHSSIGTYSSGGNYNGGLLDPFYEAYPRLAWSLTGLFVAIVFAVYVFVNVAALLALIALVISAIIRTARDASRKKTEHQRVF